MSWVPDLAMGPKGGRAWDELGPGPGNGSQGWESSGRASSGSAGAGSPSGCPGRSGAISLPSADLPEPRLAVTHPNTSCDALVALECSSAPSRPPGLKLRLRGGRRPPQPWAEGPVRLELTAAEEDDGAEFACEAQLGVGNRTRRRSSATATLRVSCEWGEKPGGACAKLLDPVRNLSVLVKNPSAPCKTPQSPGKTPQSLGKTPQSPGKTPQSLGKTLLPG